MISGASVRGTSGADRSRRRCPEYQIIDIPLAHAMFHMLYQVQRGPADPVDRLLVRLGRSTSERGAESAVPHARGIFDEHGNMMVLITLNTDFGDAFEREGENRAYFERVRRRRLCVRHQRAALRDDTLRSCRHQSCSVLVVFLT